MKITKEIVPIISGCSSELLDTILRHINTEASGDGVILLDTDAIENNDDTTGSLDELIKIVSDNNIKGLLIVRSN